MKRRGPASRPRALALRLALDKARAVAAQFPEAVVIGSDQVADLDGEPLGKPGNHERARGPAAAHARPHRGVPDRRGRGLRGDRLRAAGPGAGAACAFAQLSDAEIEAYLRAEQPYDCAGSARSEGLGIALLDAIDSDDPTALVGLPLIRTCRMLRAAGVKVL